MILNPSPWHSDYPNLIITQYTLITYFFHGSDLLSQIHFDAFRTVLVMSFSALTLAAPTIPIFDRALPKDCPAKPLQPTSTGSKCIFHDFCWLCSTSSWYVDLFLSLARVIYSSHDTVSSQIMQCFMLSEYNIRSVLSDVTAMCLGNFSWVSRSTINCQSSAEDNRFVFSLISFSVSSLLLLRSWSASISFLVDDY